jgi:hypothetical protein
MIRKLKSGEYRLYSRKKNAKTGKRRNLGTFSSKQKAGPRARRAVLQEALRSRDGQQQAKDGSQAQYQEGSSGCKAEAHSRAFAKIDANRSGQRGRQGGEARSRQ